MIDPLNESIVSLSDAAKALPRRRGGKRPHVSCIYRWTVNGCRGVVLESIQIGGTRCTSKEALSRFFQRLSGAEQAVSLSPSKARRIQQKEAKTVLARAGI